MKILISLLFVFSMASAFGFDDATIRPSWSGSWYNPDQSGHGINVEILDDERTVIYWYTYDQDGKPFWLAALGSNSLADGWWSKSNYWFENVRVEATAYYYEGMVFGEFDPATNNQQEWGTIVLDFHYMFCDFAHMEWYPVMEGFSQGSTDLVRLTTLYDLDCVPWPDQTGNWEVQFGIDAEHKYQVELMTDPDTESWSWTFEFLDEFDCLWSGNVFWGFGPHGGIGLHVTWGNQCGATAVEHSGSGDLYLEHKLCNSENECVRKDEVMIFEDEGEYLIFSR